MTAPLRILLLEDDPTDAVLIQELLEANDIACEVARAKKRAEFVSGLEDPAINLILADYKLPSFDGLSALKLAQKMRPDLPFIFVSGTLGEEVAIEALKIGATDYVLKSHLSRLAPSVKRALREAGDRAALTEINERFRLLAEFSLSGIYLIQDDLLRYVNPTIARMFGYAVDDIVNRLGPWDLVHPDDRALVSENVRRRIEGDMEEVRYECRGLRKDGSVFPVEVHGRRIKHGGSVGIVGTLVDIADRRRADDELRASEARFRDYAEIVSDWFWETGPDHRFSRVSGKPPDRAISGKFIGSYRWELAADRDEEPEKWRTHFAALDAHQPFRGFKYRIARPDGSSLYISVSGKPLFDADGKFLGYRGAAADVTAEVRAEHAEQALLETQAELAHVTRVMALGELSASIAHELYQPIGAVINDARASLHWLEKPSPDLPEAREALVSIVKSANHAAEVIERIRALTRKAPAQKAVININEVVLEVTALTRAEIQRNHVTLRTNLADDLPQVQADRVEFQQVMMNLIINAIEAMQRSARRDLLIASRSDGSKVRVEVCDSGHGLTPGTADRIFQPFFTTKPSGMGMGLAICRTIVERHGGKLSARANAPCGTTFELSIPVGSNHLPSDPMSIRTSP